MTIFVIATIIHFVSLTASAYELGSLELHHDLVQEYLQKFNKFYEGDEKVCGSASGIYEFKDPSKRIERFVEPIPDSLVAEFINKWNEQRESLPNAFYRVYSDSNWPSALHGILIEDGEKWMLIENEGGLSEPVSRFSLSPKFKFPSFEEQAVNSYLLFDSGLKPSGVKITEVTFSHDMLKGFGSDLKLDYKSISSVLHFFKKEPRHGVRAGQFLANRTLRIPLEMYELALDPNFQQAKNNRRFSKMFDMIHQKSRQIFGLDEFAALFVSMITTDLRHRGPCGAIYGKRGNVFTPKGIFDGEKPSFVNGNRYDASQHFFGYALMVHLFGEDFSKIVSWQRKQRQHLGPKARNLFRHLHDGGASLREGGFDPNSVVGLVIGRDDIREYYGMTSLIQPRRSIDVKRDAFYDFLGLQFVLAYKDNPHVLPSEIINSEKFFDKRKELGLCKPDVENWQAFDPENELFLVVTKPLSEEVICPASNGDKLSEMRRLKCKCQFSLNIYKARLACTDFHNIIERYQRALKTYGMSACGYN